ncbi:MAG: 5-dehydro-4-deoxy-D-glucuronate isomerase [Thermodesulfovibrionales bacterium]
MEIRYAVHPEHFKSMDTDTVRRQMLIQGLFEKGSLKMLYSHVDRIIVGGVCPVDNAVPLAVTKALGTEYFLERREMGIFNVGSSGIVLVDGKEYILENKDCLYIGMDSREISFKSAVVGSPARFYFNCAPAHATYPTVKLLKEDVQKVNLGTPDKLNVRTINQFIHPSVMKSCQLVMGMTELAPGSVWNTMPTHTHDRRMEVYFYFDLPEDSVVFHFLGEPSETRHVVMRNEEAVISPSWSIHSGMATSNYTFIWGMVGENQTFTDMDDVPMSALR